jgi:hypothetical protein
MGTREKASKGTMIFVDILVSPPVSEQIPVRDETLESGVYPRYAKRALHI